MFRRRYLLHASSFSSSFRDAICQSAAHTNVGLQRPNNRKSEDVASYVPIIHYTDRVLRVARVGPVGWFLAARRYESGPNQEREAVE